MAHPRMWSDKDPYLKDVRTVCLALPDAIEVEAWGRPTFRNGEKGKIFAIFTGFNEENYSVVFKPEPGERPALVEDERIYIPKYWGPSGWLALDLTKKKVDWTEIAELVEGSYRLVAKKKQLQALDERG